MACVLILLLCADVILALTISNICSSDSRIDLTLDRLGDEYKKRVISKELKRYSRSVSIKMGIAERVELFLIDKSNIRRYLPFMSFSMLAVIMGLIFLILLKPLYGILKFVPSVIIISFLFSLIPVLALDLMARYNSELIRRRLAEFISVLNRWCSVKEDIFYAFEKSVDSGIGEPLKTFIRDMVIQVRRGIEPVEALEILQLKVDNVQFKDFVVNIKQSIKHRGDIIKLLENLETQFYKIEEEYNRRRISTYRDRMLVYFVMFAVLFIAYFFIKSNPQIEQFYLFSTQGKSLLTLFCILYAGGFYLSFGIMKFKH
jgi:Flp pilus assembly protein TadB